MVGTQPGCLPVSNLWNYHTCRDRFGHGNLLLGGDSEHTLVELPSLSVGLVFTSPPYFNTREYAQYDTYEQYLNKVGRVVRQCSRTLSESRFLIMNTAPTLVARTHRGASSKRLAIPFDMHNIIVSAGFAFVDNIIWVKPSEAGWATTRGARFAADRQPLQYKTVPVTEYVLVYRKQTDRPVVCPGGTQVRFRRNVRHNKEDSHYCKSFSY